MEEKFFKIPFLSALKDMLSRDPLLEGNYLELSQKYSKERVFGLVRSISLQMTKSIQDLVSETIEKGMSPSVAMMWIQKELAEDSAIYAENVFRTNMATAYNAGRFKQSADLGKNIVAGLEFHATGGQRGDGNTRKNHALCHGLRAPVDSPLWDFFSPPLGYQCRCGVREISTTEADVKGWLDKSGNLISYHPILGNNVNIQSLQGISAGPDYETFGGRHH